MRHAGLWIFVCVCILIPSKAAHAQTDSVSHLILQLRSPNVQIRRNAAQSLGETKDPRAVAPLIAAVNDKDIDVELNAAESMGLIGKPSIGPLLDALRNPKLRERDTVVSALGRVGLDALPATILALKDPNANLRASAAAAINFIEGTLWSAAQFRDPSVVEPLIAALADTDWNVRQKSAEALGGMQDARALSPLIALLSDTDARVRSEAAYALGEFNDSAASGPLALALNDTSSQVQLYAASALAKLGDKCAIQPLSNVLQSPDEHIRDIAIDGLARIGPPAIDNLIDALNNSDNYVVHTAVRALTKIQEPRASAALSERDAHLTEVAKNYAAVIAAGKPSSIDTLIDALDEHGDPTMAEAFLNSGNKQLREAAKDWATGKGYDVISFPTPAAPLKWGSGH